MRVRIDAPVQCSALVLLCLCLCSGTCGVGRCRLWRRPIGCASTRRMWASRPTRRRWRRTRSSGRRFCRASRSSVCKARSLRVSAHAQRSGPSASARSQRRLSGHCFAHSPRTPSNLEPRATPLVVAVPGCLSDAPCRVFVRAPLFSRELELLASVPLSVSPLPKVNSLLRRSADSLLLVALVREFSFSAPVSLNRTGPTLKALCCQGYWRQTCEHVGTLLLASARTAYSLHTAAAASDAQHSNAPLFVISVLHIQSMHIDLFLVS